MESEETQQEISKTDEPIAEESAEPVAEESAKSVVEESAESVAEESAESVAEESAESVAEESAESVTEESTESVTEESAEPLAEESAETLAKESAEPVTEESAESVAEESTETVAEGSSEASSSKEYRELSREELEYYSGLVEAILFLAPDAVSLSILSKRCGLDRVNARLIVDSLVDDYDERDGGVLLREIAGGYQFTTSERYGQNLRSLFKEQKKETLSKSTMETLAIICYRQPITLPEIDDVRGVNSRTMVTTLLSRKLIKPQGYRPVPGRPTLYVTTRDFLTHFTLNSLADLPALEEIKALKFDAIE